VAVAGTLTGLDAALVEGAGIVDAAEVLDALG